MLIVLSIVVETIRPIYWKCAVYYLHFDARVVVLATIIDGTRSGCSRDRATQRKVESTASH